MRTSHAAAAVVVALAATACGHSQVRVRDGDLSRLGSAQLVRVEAHRADLGQAQDEVARAKAKLPEAKREQEMGKQDRRAADVEVERAKKALEVAEARVEAADARREYAEKLVAAREAEQQAAERRVEVVAAKVELAKLEALEQADASAASRYKRTDFTGSVDATQRGLDDAQGKARKLDDDARSSLRRWEELVRKLPATRE